MEKSYFALCVVLLAFPSHWIWDLHFVRLLVTGFHVHLRFLCLQFLARGSALSGIDLLMFSCEVFPDEISLVSCGLIFWSARPTACLSLKPPLFSFWSSTLCQGSGSVAADKGFSRSLDSLLVGLHFDSWSHSGAWPPGFPLAAREHAL
jgi:hypothetical protein